MSLRSIIGISYILEKKGGDRCHFQKSPEQDSGPCKTKEACHVDRRGRTWMGMGIDVKGTIYEGLLQKNAEDIKAVPARLLRALIKSMVEVIRLP